ncbi:uncharacterized protein LOC129225303 [Uloborus diversus]|uniref:uncharacterized protein LOC129225303 n=1 Tax=Uloborus diversus TaxID=327109 RepID=UPI00240A7E05|nr:uncharacterized protein LOC129225303 [Uloborus diversus]
MGDSDSCFREGTVLGLGNPLLDISANTGNDFLEKYGLKHNDAILAEERHLPIYSEMVEKYNAEYIAGGSCQNTMRVAQWVAKKPNVFAFMGCIGKDEFGKILETKAKEAGVLVNYQLHDTAPTGTCAVVITDNGANRSLCANLSAANHFSREHLDTPTSQSIINNAKYFYITAYFLTVSPPSIMYIAKHAHENKKTLLMNLSAPFLCTLFKEPLMEVFPYIDVLFGNETEITTLAAELGFKSDDMEKIILHIANLPKKNEERKRRVIVTQGNDDVLYAADTMIIKYPVDIVKPEEIVDTNGAGDAFVGGFLAQYIQKKSAHSCVLCGIYAATQVIKQSGCIVPEKMEFIDV